MITVGGKQYLCIAETAAILGIPQWTLRRYTDQGQIKATIHPLNGYRLYQEADVEKLTRRLREATGQ